MACNTFASERVHLGTTVHVSTEALLVSVPIHQSLCCNLSHPITSEMSARTPDRLDSPNCRPGARAANSEPSHRTMPVMPTLFEVGVRKAMLARSPIDSHCPGRHGLATRGQFGFHDPTPSRLGRSCRRSPQFRPILPRSMRGPSRRWPRPTPNLVAPAQGRCSAESGRDHCDVSRDRPKHRAALFPRRGERMPGRNRPDRRGFTACLVAQASSARRLCVAVVPCSGVATAQSLGAGGPAAMRVAIRIDAVLAAVDGQRRDARCIARLHDAVQRHPQHTAALPQA